MKNFPVSTFFLSLFSFLIGQSDNSLPTVEKKIVAAGRIEALVTGNHQTDFILVQLDLKNDSLFTLVDDVLPGLELFSGSASYHRIITKNHLDQIQHVLTNEFYTVLDDKYNFPNGSRSYWTDQKNGNEAMGTIDEVNNNDCMCLGGTSNCIVVGYNDDWWDPLDYWGEAWYGFLPPYYQSIDEIRVTVRGAQCDDLPVWSETFMGMMDSNGNWSQDYELSIDYTDNTYIVGNIWSNSMLVPRIGSEDNYCIDHVKLEFYYTCPTPPPPGDVNASDGEFENQILITWAGVEDAINYNIYRDNTLIMTVSGSQLEYTDESSQPMIEYNYCVESVTECGTSGWVCDTGFSVIITNVENNLGWNLVSLPLEVEDAYYNIIYPGAINGTLYSYNGEYSSEIELIPGEGYWLKFPDNGSTVVTGAPINELVINLSEGWNLISGTSQVSTIVDSSGIIIAGLIYGYDGGFGLYDGYYTVTELLPGRAYWVRAFEDGEITIISTGNTTSVSESSDLK